MEEIELTNCELNEFPLEIFHNSTFKIIKITNQPKVKKVPKNFALKTTRLENFECSQCEIDIVEDGAFNNLDKLERLDLHNNHIVELTNEIMTPLKNLRSLNLADNKMNRFTTDVVKQAGKLERIDLSHNPLKELDLLEADKVLPNLKVVYIVGTNLPEAVINQHKKNTNIRFITEQDNTITQ